MCICYIYIYIFEILALTFGVIARIDQSFSKDFFYCSLSNFYKYDTCIYFMDELFVQFVLCFMYYIFLLLIEH